MPKSTAAMTAALVPLAPLPPDWLAELLGPVTTSSAGDAGPHAGASLEGMDVVVKTGQFYTHVAVTIPGADTLSPEVLHERVRDGYLAVASALNAQQRHPLRFWNFVPHIHAPSGDGLDRYMVFNGGRFAACEYWLGSPNDFDHTLAAASGVGVAGPDLAIHCLAADVAGEPVENPRQIPAYRYSRRYGPRPPCFARATRVQEPVNGAWWLLVAGTASIRGEDTMHIGDVAAQTAETLDNLDALLAAAEEAHGTSEARARFRNLRVYLVRPDDLTIVRDAVEARYGTGVDVEFAQAELCRTDLLVEIEGVAEL